MDIIFFAIIILLVLSLSAVTIFVVRRWNGVWRLAGVLPATALALVSANIIVGVMIDGTSHNLWPLELAMWSLGGLAYLGILSLIRKVVSRSR